MEWAQIWGGNKKKIGPAQQAIIEAIQNQSKIMEEYKNDLKKFIHDSSVNQRETLEILRGNMNNTKHLLNEANNLLQSNINTTKAMMQGMMKSLGNIEKKGEDKTYGNTAEVAKKLGGSIARVVDGAVYLFTEEVRYPQEALGLLSLNSTYNKKVAPKHKTVRGWMRPTFVTDIDSMKQRMGLEIFFVLMWQEDSRVNWALLKEMKEGVAFSFRPSVLE